MARDRDERDLLARDPAEMRALGYGAVDLLVDLLPDDTEPPRPR